MQSGGADGNDRFGSFVAIPQVGEEVSGLLEGKDVSTGKNGKEMDVVVLHWEGAACKVLARIGAKHRGHASRRKHEFGVLRPAGVKRPVTDPVGHVVRQARYRVATGHVARKRIGGVVVVALEMNRGAVLFAAFRRFVDLDRNGARAVDRIPDRSWNVKDHWV